MTSTVHSPTSEARGANGAAADRDGRLVAVLERLDARLARLEQRMGRLDAVESQLPALLATATDTVDSIVARLGDAGFDLDERMRSLARAADRLTSPEAIAALDSMLGSGVLDPSAVAVLGKLGRAIAASGAESSERVGAFGLLRALRDPTIQRALGFTLRLAREFGQALEGPPLLFERGAPARKELTP
jgi:hypothetical protein